MLNYFNEKMEKGELDGAFYSIIIQKKVSEDVKIKLYETVHMLGHTNITKINKLTERKFLLQRINKNGRRAYSIKFNL